MARKVEWTLPNGNSDADGDTPETETPPVHPSVLPNAPESIEPQLLFLRAAAYLQNAIFLVPPAEDAMEQPSRTSRHAHLTTRSYWTTSDGH
jgi:hypothetical protein